MLEVSMYAHVWLKYQISRNWIARCYHADVLLNVYAETLLLKHKIEAMIQLAATVPNIGQNSY